MQSLSAARTLELLRFLRAHPVHRQPHVPPPADLEPVQREYWSAVTPFCCDRARHSLAGVQPELLEDLRGQGRRRGLFDQQERSPKRTLDPTRAQELVRRARDGFAQSWPPRELPDVVRRFALRADQHARLQLDRQVRLALHVEYASLEQPVRDVVQDWVHSNVGLLRSVALGHETKPGYFDRVSLDVAGAYAKGTAPEDLAQQLAEDHAIALRDARRIARTEVSRLNTAVTKHRQTALGVSGYAWRCVRDNRVRDCHAALDGTKQRWDSPPLGGGTDETEAGHPGDGINCRCYAEPDFSGLLG